MSLLRATARSRVAATVLTTAGLLATVAAASARPADRVRAAADGSVRPVTAAAATTPADVATAAVSVTVPTPPPDPRHDEIVATPGPRREPEPEPAASSDHGHTVWDRLADCESGDWHRGQPLPGTRRWDYGLRFSHGDHFEGGLNFAPTTWDSFRDPGMPDHAGHATREQQIVVGERVLAAQGWGAWPVCSRKLGLRG